MREMDPKVKEFHNLIARLRKLMNPALVEIEGHFEQAVVFSFVNGFKVVVCPHKPLYKAFFSTSGLVHLFDENFKSLDLFSKGKLKNLEQEDCSLYINNALFAFTRKQNTKAHAQVNYGKTYYHGLKVLLSSHFGLKKDPSREFFLYGNDELRSRYEESSLKIKVPKEGIEVRIDDDSALLFHGTKEYNKRSVDLHTGRGYLSKNFLYLGDITTYKEIKHKAKGCSVSYNGATGEKKYLMPVLKKGIKLDQQPRIAYEKIDGRTFLLKKSKGRYFLEDDKGTIEIHHPDMLVYIL